METTRIIVPNPTGDSMGASIRSLLEVMDQWSLIPKENNIVFDLKNVLFAHPFLILPLCAIVSDERERGKIINYELHRNTESYMETIHFPLGFDALTTIEWKTHLLNFSSKTYLPACKIPVSVKHTSIREQLLTTFENILMQQINLRGQIITAIKYLISDAKALEHAINGKSTKQITETRGYGIDTSRRMLVNGLKGKYLLFSGKALYIYTNELEQITPLQAFGWKGTLLALQIPSKIPHSFNYTTFLE